jgi:hypothetical protein
MKSLARWKDEREVALRPGLFTLDPRDIKKFGDEEEDFDYSAGEEAVSEPGDKAPAFPGC